jgi:adenine-specific DNA-methyltransferase
LELVLDTYQLRLDLGAEDSPPGHRSATTNVPFGSSLGLAGAMEPKGVIYTKPWVVDLILDLAGYRASEDLADMYVVEPAAGEGAFLMPMIRRLLTSARMHGREMADVRRALHAYELDEQSAAHASNLAATELRENGVATLEADEIAKSWVTVGDYLLDSRTDRRADLVVGNPPYIRYDDIAQTALERYRRLYPTMVGRGDIYIGFIEAGIRQLKQHGALAFICADRWMRSAYGVQLRRLVARACGVEAVIEMHNAPAFENEVSAYPAVIVLRRGSQGSAIVASAGPLAGPLPGTESLADAVVELADGRVTALSGFSAARTDWHVGPNPWPSVEPDQRAILHRLENGFHSLEDPRTGTKIGIGVATGSDRVYVTEDESIVEADRLLPLAMAADTREGILKWSRHYLVDPWAPGSGLVDLGSFPKLRDYLECHRQELEQRDVARRHTKDWYRTIDRVSHGLIYQPKLYFPDMKLTSNPVLDAGQTYPHHNLYYLISNHWDLEVLGGLLLSRVAQLFIEAYSVKMRGGTLRFQAQYLRKIRVPDPASLTVAIEYQLRDAFRSHDADAATAAAIQAYGIADMANALQ